MTQAPADAATPVVSAFYDRFPYPGDPLQDGPPPGYNWRWCVDAAYAACTGAVPPRSASGSPFRVLDAGCGTGALAQEAMRRGAEVLAIDLSPTLVNLARDRHAQDLLTDPTLSAKGGSITFLAGDMLGAEHGDFDHVVCMDSLIHYDTQTIANAVESLTKRTRHSVLFTFAPHSPLLAVAHAMGRLFPRSDRSPQLAPIRKTTLHVYIERAVREHGWRPGHMQRVSSGFYTSQAWEWKRT